MKKQLLTLFSILSAGVISAQVYFQENFETGLPATWTSFIGTNGLGTSSSWGVVNPGYLSDSALKISYEAAGGITEDWLVTPAIAVGLGNSRLVFNNKQQFNPEWGSTYEIKVSTVDQTTHASFTTLDSWGEAEFGGTSWKENQVDLSLYAGQTIYIAFVFSQDDGDSWYIDSVVVDSAVAIPPCRIPKNLSANSITNTSAVIEWSGAGLNYELEYLNGRSAPNSVKVIVSDSTYTFAGLNSNASITYRVREICGAGDTSGWSFVEDFLTTCTATAVTLPYFENFETDSNGFIPCGWARENLSSGGSEWLINEVDLTNALAIYYDSEDEFAPKNGWVVSPEFTLTGGVEYKLSFKYAADSDYPEDFAIYYGNGQASAGLTNVIASFPNAGTAPIGSIVFVDTAFKFTPATSGNFAIGVHATSGADLDFIAIDDFSLEIAPLTSLTNELNNTNFSVYPNPSNGEFTVLNDSEKTVNITVTDVQGKVVNQINNLQAYSTKQISLTNAEAGMYFLSITDGVTTTKKKVVIK